MTYEDQFRYKVVLNGKRIAYDVTHEEAERVFSETMAARNLSFVKHYYHGARGLTYTESKTDADGFGDRLIIRPLTPIQNIDLTSQFVPSNRVPTPSASPSRTSVHHTWYDFSEDQKAALQTGGRASVLTSTFGAWVKDTLKLLQNEAKAVQPKYRGEYFSGLLCIKWNGETGGSIVFVSDAGIVSEPFKSVNVERELDARITDFKALADWMKTLQPDRLDIIGYRNNYARFDYAPVSSERPTYNYFGQIRSGKPVASAAFGPMSLLWKSEGLTE